MVCDDSLALLTRSHTSALGVWQRKHNKAMHVRAAAAPDHFVESGLAAAEVSFARSHHRSDNDISAPEIQTASELER